ncbi:MAG: molecular chaperone DnaJ [Patescibacteria group bacterium]
MAKNYYDILGVSKTASADEIKSAFRKLAHEHHPDKKSGNEAKFKELNEAYQVLGNSEKRQQYDQFGQTFSGAGSNGGGFGGRAQGGNPFGSAGGYNSGNVNFDFGDLGDLGDVFGNFFGGGARRESVRGRDLETSMTIEFEEAVFGTEKEIELEKQIKCNQCQGTGAASGSKIVNCKTCGGSGRVVRLQQTILGNFQSQSVCPECRGVGKKPEQACSKCGGRGHVHGREKIKVIIPAGISDGQSVKLSGQGEAGEQGQSGDLYIWVKVKSNKNFVRRGDDILSEAHLNLKQAILGDKIKVETVDGPVDLKIPEGTQSQTKFRLKGKGVTHLREHGRGDQIVEVIVDIPKGLSRQQKKILEQADL